MDDKILQECLAHEFPTMYIRPYTKPLKADLERFMKTPEVTREVEITRVEGDGNLYKVTSRYAFHHPLDFFYSWWGRLYRFFSGMAKSESKNCWPNTENRFYLVRMGTEPIEKVKPVLI